jgi:hypothetical protein
MLFLSMSETASPADIWLGAASPCRMPSRRFTRDISVLPIDLFIPSSRVPSPHFQSVRFVRVPSSRQTNWQQQCFHNWRNLVNLVSESNAGISAFLSSFFDGCSALRSISFLVGPDLSECLLRRFPRAFVCYIRTRLLCEGFQETVSSVLFVTPINLCSSVCCFDG